ncbi:MAG: phasin family protein [Alphaproteobacteria bacterium]|nr:phasin family protein [Alphaproteobacteria bacterium]
MSQSNPFTDFFSQNDISKLLGGSSSAPFDMALFLESQRKNMQAMTEAQALAIENMRALAQKQSEALSQMIEDNSVIAREIMAEGSPEKKMAKNADIFKTVYERNIRNLQDMSDMIGKSGQEASEIINKRVSASMNEIKTLLEKDTKAA